MTSYTHHFLFEKPTAHAVRLVIFEKEKDNNHMCVSDILEMPLRDESEKELKYGIRKLIEHADTDNWVETTIAGPEGSFPYDETLEGRAQLRSSKTVNVVSALLMGN